MVIREDGTKWACQSCLKGHRVSGCTHTDRELTLVPKKGRPVTQCQHCRQERKKRSAHVKCDCGEADKPHHTREKCIHLREAEERARAGLHDDPADDKDAAHLAAIAEEQGCCCHHGGPCSCATWRRDSEKSVNGTPAPCHGPAVHKPRLESTRSDGSITVFANGHHKPVHRKNHAAHESGRPYPLPTPRVHTEHSPFDAERRLSRSEQPSPRLTPADRGNPTGLDFASLGLVRSHQSFDSVASDNFAFSPLDPVSGLAEHYDPWSNFPSAEANNLPDNNPFGVWATTYDNGAVNQPALTAASSGTQSEIDEIPTTEEMYGFPMPSIQEDPSMGVNGEPTMGNESPVNRRSLPPNFFGNSDFSLPRLDNEWEMPITDLNNPDDNKTKSMETDTHLDFGDAAWVNVASPSIAMAQRSQSTSTRPHAPTSAGPSRAPNDEIIKQLFPGIEIDGGIFGAHSPSMTASTAGVRKRGSSAAARSGPTSAPVDFTDPTMDDSVAFTTQSWSDGSISVPNDAFTSPFQLDQEFSSPEFASTWQSQ